MAHHPSCQKQQRTLRNSNSKKIQLTGELINSLEMLNLQSIQAQRVYFMDMVIHISRTYNLKSYNRSFITRIFFLFTGSVSFSLTLCECLFQSLEHWIHWLCGMMLKYFQEQSEIMLVHKHTHICIVKFTQNWFRNTIFLNLYNHNLLQVQGIY